MKPQISRKMLVQLSVLSTVVVLAVILVYLGRSGRPAPARPGVSTQVARQTAAPPIVPPPAPAATAGHPAPTSAGAAPPRGIQVAQTTPAAGQPPARPTPAGGVGGPAPATKPGAGPSATPASPGGSGPAAPSSTAPAKPQDPEAAVVGTGQRGRSDPFAPLVTNEPVRATPGPALPPPPGVGLPMPPGFAAPGGPGAPPSAPGAGMRVTGIMGSRERVAIIEVDGQTHIVGVGERVGDAVVVSILPEKVVMKQHNVTFELGFGGDRSS